MLVFSSFLITVAGFLIFVLEKGEDGMGGRNGTRVFVKITGVD